jgi:uncharacterized protein (TIGR02001 family)
LLRSATGLALASALVAASPARAQLSATVALESNAMFRGETISENDPAASLEVTLDHDSGLFAGASVIVAAGDQSPRIVSNTQYGGFAGRAGEITYEIGAIHRNYGSATMADTSYRGDYYEGFVGVSRKDVRLRLYVSPDYLVDGRTSYYGEVNAQLLKRGKWTFRGHGGISAIPQDIGTPGGLRIYYDWSLSASRPLGDFNANLGIAGSNYPIFLPRNGVGFFSDSPKFYASISRTF